MCVWRVTCRNPASLPASTSPPSLSTRRRSDSECSECSRVSTWVVRLGARGGALGVGGGEQSSARTGMCKCRCACRCAISERPGEQEGSRHVRVHVKGTAERAGERAAERAGERAGERAVARAGASCRCKRADGLVSQVGWARVFERRQVQWSERAGAVGKRFHLGRPRATQHRAAVSQPSEVHPLAAATVGEHHQHQCGRAAAAGGRRRRRLRRPQQSAAAPRGCNTRSIRE